jgi:hypothetical protein
VISRSVSTGPSDELNLPPQLFFSTSTYESVSSVRLRLSMMLISRMPPNTGPYFQANVAGRWSGATRSSDTGTMPAMPAAESRLTSASGRTGIRGEAASGATAGAAAGVGAGATAAGSGSAG